jgi:hypothetical protein
MSIQLETIVKNAVNLPYEERVELIMRVSESLLAKPKKSKQLEYGKYKDTGLRQSTEEDFKLAEWHPSEAELNGE